MNLDTLETAYAEAFGLFEALKDLQFIREPNFQATVGHGYPPLYNNVFCSRFSSENSAAIEEVIALFQTRKTSFHWRIWPNDTPSDLSERLVKLGFVLVGKNVILATDRSRLEKIELPAQPGICEKVENSEQMKEWCRLFRTGFQLSERESLPFFKLFELNPNRLDHYIVRFKQKAAGIMSAIIKNSSVGFYNGSVDPEFRRLGLYRQLFDFVQRQALERSSLKSFYGEVVPATYTELKRNHYQDLCFTHHYRFDFKT